MFTESRNQTMASNFNGSLRAFGSPLIRVALDSIDCL